MTIKALLRGPYALSTALAAGIALTLLIIGIETQWSAHGAIDSKAKRVAPAKVADAGLLPAFNLPPVDQGFTESAIRPIFVPTRRATPVSNVAVSSMVKGQFLLQGTSLTKDFGDIAILREIATNRTFVVRKGEQIAGKGIAVEKVEPHRVVLKQGDDSEEVGMKTSGSPKAPVASASGGSIFPSTPAQPAAPGAARPTPPSGAPAPSGRTSATSQPPSGQTPQPATAVPSPSTPEEILARRRAVRSQQVQ